MKRRHFTKLGLATMLGLPPLLNSTTNIETRGAKKVTTSIINAYYLLAHMFTLVPHHVREDMKWMADIGTNVVTIAVLEQDLFASVENIKIVCAEAERAGMQVYAIPSRWGGLLAGAPKVPSIFSVTHPYTWMLKQDGTPIFSSVSGVLSSIHYPETYQFFCESLDAMFKQFNIAGVVWDEPKNFRMDYSSIAVEKLGKDAPREAHLNATADFFGRVSSYIKEKYPTKHVSLFLQANAGHDEIETAAQIKALDYFGCDGRPWDAEEDKKWIGVGEFNESGKGKILLGKGERFISLAKQNGKKTLLLIETHNLTRGMIPGVDRGLPRVLKLNPDQIIYYYYPINTEDADVNMSVIAKHIKAHTGKKQMVQVHSLG